MASWASPMRPWNTTYQFGRDVGRTSVSCKAAAGTRSAPAKNATRISQKIQRQRRSTPIDTSVRKAARVIGKTVLAHRGQLGGKLTACS